MTAQPVITKLVDLYDVPALTDGETIVSESGELVARSLPTGAIARLQDASDLTGTPATGKGWVRGSDGSMVWTDLAVQSELDAEGTARAAGDAAEATSRATADAAEAASRAAADSAHAALTTAVHGITDTSKLVASPGSGTQGLVPVAQSNGTITWSVVTLAGNSPSGSNADGQLVGNKRTVLDTTFAGPPPVGTLAGILFRSTAHAYNLAFRADTGLWLHLRRGIHGRDYGAIWDRTTDDTAALQAALNETTANALHIQQPLVWLPAGEALISATLTPAAVGGGWIQGEGGNATKLVLADGFDGPVFSSAGLASGVRILLRDVAFDCKTVAGHAATFPLLDLTKNDVGSIQGIGVNNSPGDGIWHKGNGDTVRWFYPVVLTNGGHGFVIDSSQDHSFIGADVEGNGKSGIFVTGYATRTFGRGDVHSSRTERNGEYGIRVARTAMFRVRDWYSDNELNAYIDDDVYKAGIEQSTLLGNSSVTVKYGAHVYNLGAFSRIRDIDGIINPFDDAVEYHWPGSVALDPYEARTDATAWKTAGTGAVTKTYSLDGIRFIRWFGKVPVRISSGTAAAANYAYKEIVCAAGDSIDFMFYWYGAPSGVTNGGVIVRIVDDANPGTDLYNSGTLACRAGSAGDWGEERHWVPFRVPTGVTKLRFIAQPSIAGTTQAVYSSRLDAIVSRSVANPSFQSATGYAYASGIAAGWTNLSGAGTPSEETSIVKVPGKSSQKIVTTGSNSYYLSQTLAIDSSRWYELKGWVYVPAGTSPQRAVIGLGSDLSSSYIERLPVFENDRWVGVQSIIKPNSYTKLIVGLNNGGTAYFQLASLRPLRERYEQWWRHASEELDLSGAAATSYLFTPTIDEVIRRVVVTYTAAGTGTVNVGVLGDAARFGTLGGAASQGDQKEIVLSRSDLRCVNPLTTGALPLQVSTPGGGSGKAFVTIEGGGTL